MDLIETLRVLLASKGIQDPVVARVVATAQVCLAFKTVREEQEDRIPIGASKVGGSADLPPGSSWPAAEGVNFRFIAQFDLSEVARMLLNNPLPGSGLLSFFWCQEHEIGTTPQGVRVIYTPDTTKLVRVSDPWAAIPERVGFIRRLWGEKPSARGQGFWPCRPELSVKVTIADLGGPRRIGKGLMSAGEFDLIYGGKLDDELEAAGMLITGHRLLGEACPIQEPVEYEAEWDPTNPASDDREAREKSAASWRLLLQVYADGGPEFGFGDLGSIYFLIREADLAAQRWDQVRVVMQCH